LVADASAYYLLTLHPAVTDDANRFHTVQVRVSRPGVEVRARGGYWSASPDELYRARLAAFVSPPVRTPAPPTRVSPLIRPWFGIARADEGKLRVNFVWEPAAITLGRRAGVAPADVTMKVIQSDGATLFEQDVDAATSRAVFETAPGRLRVELAIRGADSRVLDTDIRDLIVGALAGPVEMGTAEVLRSRTARDFRRLQNDPDAIPVASRAFSRAERLLIRVPAYPSDGNLALRATLKSKLGSSLRPLTVESGPAPGVYQIDLPLANLASGDYSVAIVAESPAGDANESVDFRVTP
jgi:hypothetical protein